MHKIKLKKVIELLKEAMAVSIDDAYVVHDLYPNVSEDHFMNISYREPEGWVHYEFYRNQNSGDIEANDHGFTLTDVDGVKREVVPLFIKNIHR
jgi:hypothetical protein